MQPKSFHAVLADLTDEYAHKAYRITSKFPKEEIYGLTSQLRRSSLSVALNYREGFARRRVKSYIHFLEISYGSLKESQYLLKFAFQENQISQESFADTIEVGERIGRMIWSLIKKLEESSSNFDPD